MVDFDEDIELGTKAWLQRELERYFGLPVGTLKDEDKKMII